VITVMGLTKTFAMGGWRIGFVHAAPEVCAAMASIQAHLITCANSFVQAGAAAALGDAPRPEVLDLWADWERRCRFVASELGSMPGVTCHEPEGGYFAWANIEATGWDDQALAGVLLKEHMVAVVPGSAFGPGGRGYLRVTCVRSWPEIEEAVVRIRAALETRPRSTGEPRQTPAS
jgi:aspartate/methionine/tyrosine aminotransferase